MTIHIEQEAREAAEREYPLPNDLSATSRALRLVAREHFANGYIAGATRPEPSVTDAEVEAAARTLWRADDAEMDTSWTSSREFYMDTARAALEAARATREGKNQ